MLVFRDVSSLALSAGLVSELERLCRATRPSLEALFRAAELECALDDTKHPSAATAGALTDTLARAWLAGDASLLDRAYGLVGQLALPGELRLRRPEGYAFYALDPATYAEAARLVVSGSRPVCVVGVRTIGTSLSAIVGASLERAGVPARRITVRPGGHPWDRRLRLEAREAALLDEVAEKAELVVVDEGPGLSGSTFLAVGEALRGRGVPADRIRFLTSHPILPERLAARDANRRFAPFASAAVRCWSPPQGALDLSAGAWRQHSRLRAWPACWRLQERVKYLDPREHQIKKFSGFAHYAGEVSKRATLLADGGYGPKVTAAEAGFLAYGWLPGRPARSRVDKAGALRRIAQYIAFRAREFTATVTRQRELEAMTSLNVFEALGTHLPRSFELDVRLPVVPDGRMLPHEWLLADSGRLMKTDGAEHGDDHFFPGPTDIAWDVAGASVEWNLDRAETAALCGVFDALTGDRVTQRLACYEIAYAAFRVGIATFAERDSTSDDARRWSQAREHYRTRLRAAIGRLSMRAQRSATP